MSECKSLTSTGQLFVALNHRMKVENFVKFDLEELAESSLEAEDDDDDIRISETDTLLIAW
eukprot:CAMPEP_0168343764 /NCGR_PEP_ID=MMETSP0213-20121227/16344_1 /TAXON_ID=151035 /ORGANISM="Euplotes harpa, Strain FSP1.4" /LENGTH=60 /DNA_ID=CAMNT_0008351235 /DNA_START=130 /DNA_END=309 /DNA_ORIENTATION=-